MMDMLVTLLARISKVGSNNDLYLFGKEVSDCGTVVYLFDKEGYCLLC